MARWKRRSENEIDFEAMEELFEDLLETLPIREIDFTKPLKLGFTLTLDDQGYLSITEFGLIKEKFVPKQEPIIEFLDYGQDLTIIVDSPELNKKNLGVKVLERSIILSSGKKQKFVKKIKLPCNVKKNPPQINHKNNIVEILLKKQ